MTIASVTARQPLLRVSLLTTALLIGTAAAQGTPVLLAPKPYARVISAPINALSGIVKVPGRENTYWVHNGSPDSARIFAITAEGKSILPTYSKFTSYGDEPEQGKEQWQGFPVLDAKNVDWEDIAIDRNYLYIADMGNVGNARRDLGIYLVSKIDPTASTRTAVIQYLQVVYPDQSGFPGVERRFDSESLFISNDTLYLITSHRQSSGSTYERGANLYRLDTRDTDKPNVLTKVDSNLAILAAAGASLSPDGHTLAVISDEALWLFDKPVQGDHWLSASSKRYPFDQSAMKKLAAVTWIDNDTLLMGNRQRDLFKVALADLPAPVKP